VDEFRQYLLGMEALLLNQHEYHLAQLGPLLGQHFALQLPRVADHLGQLLARALRQFRVGNL
jgi:hypothetical protein